MYYLPVFLVIIFLLSIYIWWRFFFFFRDPNRAIPEGNNIVSPADGTIVYVKDVQNKEIPLAIKKGSNIRLSEIFDLLPEQENDWTLIGIFMHPTSVHVNRAPISGTIEKIFYRKSNNLPMTLMWWRVLLKRRPFEWRSKHVLTNERNTLLIKGIVSVFVTQIADIYVNRIECFVHVGQKVSKGDRIGMIKFGSQVDLLIPKSSAINILVKEGDKVFAGESVIAQIVS